MSKAAWVHVAPESGSGNASVAVSSTSPHTGRVASSKALSISAPNCETKTVTVNQAGKPEYVSYDSTTATAQQAGQNVTISGKSNSSKLTFSLGTGALAISLPSTYMANSVSIPNGGAISGDPGASAEFPFSITINVPENTSTDEKSRQIIVTDNGGHTATCTLTQSAGDAYLEVSPTTLELDWQGTAQSFSISSNTT